MRLKVILALVLSAFAPLAGHGQLASPFSNSVWPAQTFTASGVTGATIQLNGLTVSSTVGSSFASGTITLTGTSLSTVTFSVLGSSDNGATFYALPIYTQASPTTAPSSSITATANGVYQVSLAGITHVKFVTSGTFTATNVSLVLTASPNVSIARGSSSGGGLPGVTVTGTPSTGQTVVATSPSTATWQTLTGGATAAQLNSLTFAGNKIGENTGSSYLADNGSGERHAFDLRNTNEWDSVASGGSYLSPVFSNGSFYSSGSGAAKVARAFSSPQNNFVLQAILHYSSSNVASFLTISNGTAGAIITSGDAFGFFGGNFIYYNYGAGTGFQTLLPASSLVNNTNYLVTFVGLNGNAIASIAPVGSTNFTTFLGLTTYTGVTTLQIESDSTVDQFSKVRYASGSQGYTLSIGVPYFTSDANYPTAMETAVVSGTGSGTVNTWIVLPPSYRVGSTAPWVIYNHGAGQSGNAIFSGNQNTLINALVNAGYVVVASDYNNSECWGNPACVQDIANLQAQYQSLFSLAPKPYVIMESMGGLVTLNSIYQGTLSPRAVVGLYPVYSLAGMYAGGSGFYASYIQTAFSFSSPSGYAAATAGYDPALNSISTYSPIPFDIWCSASDTVVSCANDGQLLASQISAAGGVATYNASSGNHGDPSNFNPVAVVDFFKAH